jgi:hypothetical protein
MLVNAIDERSVQIENNSRSFQIALRTKKWGPLGTVPRIHEKGLGGYPSRAGIRDALRQLSQLGVCLLFFFQSFLERTCNILQP